MALGAAARCVAGAALPRVALLAAIAVALSAQGAAAKESYYDILGVPKDADDKAIKQAYRKMALKWHPDKNPDNREEAEKRFREVAEAYEVLSHPVQRKNYDDHGSSTGTGFGGADFNPFDSFGGFGGFRDPKDLFKDMFGDSDPFSDFSKFFEDIKFENFDGPGAADDGKAEEAKEALVEALVSFYKEVEAHDKAKPEKVKEVLAMKKWKGKEDKMFRHLQSKYSPEHIGPLLKLESAFKQFKKSKKSKGSGGGDSDFAGFGEGFGDIQNMFKMAGGGSDSFNFEFTSTSMGGGGKMTREETKIVNGKRVTKKLEKDGDGTRATLEEEEGGRIKRQTGVKKAEQLDHSERDEM